MVPSSGPGGKRYATFLAEPFVNYNFGGGWFVSSAPIITDDETHAGRKWTAPVGAVAGRIIQLGGKLPACAAIPVFGEPTIVFRLEPAPAARVASAAGIPSAVNASII